MYGRNTRLQEMGNLYCGDENFDCCKAKTGYGVGLGGWVFCFVFEYATGKGVTLLKGKTVPLCFI